LEETIMADHHHDHDHEHPSERWKHDGVRVIKGEREPAIADLRQLAEDGSRGLPSRVLAVDALLHVGANSEAAGAGRPVLEAAEKAGDLHLALDMCARLQEAFKRLNDHGAQLALQRDISRLVLRLPNPVLKMDVEDVELQPFVAAPSMSIIVRGKGRMPEQDVRLQAIVVLKVEEDLL